MTAALIIVTLIIEIIVLATLIYIVVAFSKERDRLASVIRSVVQTLMGQSKEN